MTVVVVVVVAVIVVDGRRWRGAGGAFLDTRTDGARRV